MRVLLLSCLLFSLCHGATAVQQTKQASIIDMQTMAYNANNAESYARSFHDDIEVYSYPYKVLTSSKGALIESIRKTFKARKPHAGIVSVIEVNNKIITHEKVVYTIQGVRRTSHIAKIYEFEDGLIRRMTFIN